MAWFNLAADVVFNAAVDRKQEAIIMRSFSALLLWLIAITLILAVVAISASEELKVNTQAHDTSQPAANLPYEAPWGPNCNETILSRAFALEMATDFNVTQDERNRIDDVFSELEGGYGGTLVTAPPDAVLDSPAFLAHFLRAFSTPGDLSQYDYAFERIADRLSGAPRVLDDRRLDWDMWRAFLVYENFVASGNDANEYQTAHSINRLDSAKDLLWWYLTHNSQQIRDDKQRQSWWVDQLSAGMRAHGGRPMRRWFLLQLVACSDTKAGASKRVIHDRRIRKITPDPTRPFLVVDGIFAENQRPQPPFLQAIGKIAASQRLSYVLWDIDPDAMPATMAVETDLALRPSQFAPALVLSQESWSKEPADYGVNFSRPIGRSSSYSNVSIPFVNRADGVFFFTYKRRLYIWPKARMDDAVIQLLLISGIIDDERFEQFLAQGFARLEATETGNR